MDVIVLAGGVLNSEDPLFPFVPDGVPKNKAFITVNGKPILQWVLQALEDSSKIDNIILVGQSESSGFTSSKPMYHLPDTGSMVENIISGVTYSSQLNSSSTHTLIASGDIPLVEPQMVEWVIEHVENDQVDISYYVITDQVMEGRFPGSNRTYAPLKGMRVCGGDLTVISHEVVTQNTALWKQLRNARKSVFRQAAIFGPRLLIGLLLRQLELEQLAKYLSKRLGLEARAVVCPFAEVAMDIDKPHQLELVRQELGGA